MGLGSSRPARMVEIFCTAWKPQMQHEASAWGRSWLSGQWRCHGSLKAHDKANRIAPVAKTICSGEYASNVSIVALQCAEVHGGCSSCSIAALVSSRVSSRFFPSRSTTRIVGRWPCGWRAKCCIRWTRASAKWRVRSAQGPRDERSARRPPKVSTKALRPQWVRLELDAKNADWLVIANHHVNSSPCRVQLPM